MLEKVISNDLWDEVFLDLDDDTGAFFVGFISDIRDAVDDFITGKGGHVFDHGGLVYLIWGLGDDNAGSATAGFLGVELGTDGNGASTGGEVIGDAFSSKDDAASWEVRTLDVVLH